MPYNSIQCGLRSALSFITAIIAIHRYKCQGFKQSLESVANILLDPKELHLHFPDSEFFYVDFVCIALFRYT